MYVFYITRYHCPEKNKGVLFNNFRDGGDVCKVLIDVTYRLQLVCAPCALQSLQIQTLLLQEQE
jgi:hypothetical protein